MTIYTGSGPVSPCTHPTLHLPPSLFIYHCSRCYYYIIPHSQKHPLTVSQPKLNSHRRPRCLRSCLFLHRQTSVRNCIGVVAWVGCIELHGFFPPGSSRGSVTSYDCPTCVRFYRSNFLFICRRTYPLEYGNCLGGLCCCISVHNSVFWRGKCVVEKLVGAILCLCLLPFFLPP